ncbi:MAG: DUF1223 domain-containing protein [Alphaproteobacteria bacterium]|nr:DUF1223 domain-containing protein [Alphaproteobacteria bacterium]
MISKFLKTALIILVGFSLTSVAQAGNGPTVVELFTTQGCSACPAADRILTRIVSEKDPQLITLSCHVTYFDNTTWKDEFSKPFCDARQSEYFSSLDLPSLYTPQMIINGKFGLAGNKDSAVRAGIAMGQSLKAIQPIQLWVGEGVLNITLPALRLEKPADVWLFGYSREDSSIITAGENRGEVLQYANTVKSVTKLMAWQGQYLNMAYPLAEIQGDSWAVIAQYADYTDIVAAGKTEK